MEAINAMATAYSNAGVNASTIGTQIRRFSSLMRDNSTAAQEFFLKIGTTQKAFANAMQSGKKEADAAMKGIATSLKNLSDKEFQKVIHGMDILASNSITLLRNNADEFLRHFQRLNDGVTGEIDRANLISEGYQASFEIMKNSASEAFIALTETAAPVIQQMIDSFARFFDFVKKNSKAIVEVFNIMLDGAKWGIFAGVVYKTLTALKSFYIGATMIAPSLVRINVSLAASSTGMKGFAVAVGFARAAVQGLTLAIRTMLLTNPVGWLALAAGAVAAYTMATSDASEATKDFTKSMTLAQQVRDNTKKMSEERTKLAGILEKLATANGAYRDSLIQQAAASENHIAAMTLENKKLQEQIELEEKRAKVQVQKERIDILEVRIKAGEKNGENVDNMKKQLTRLKEDYTRMEVQLSFEKAMAEFNRGEAKNIIAAIKNIQQMLVLHPEFSPEAVAALKQNIENLKAKLGKFGIGDSIINSEDID
jgi:hypothetical protein